MSKNDKFVHPNFDFCTHTSILGVQITDLDVHY